MIRWFFWFLIFSGTAMACESNGQRMVEETQNAPEVHLVVDEILLAQPFSVLVSICNEITVGDIRVDAIMPAHQHGLNYVPEVTALGDGVFRVDQILFHMPGLWQLQIDVEFRGESLSYTSEIELK
ncbi:FixH family protein [Ruegeria arenilitoris]|uniref:FixH family protein n=1 Tax=Ruegeria arenilitoris TaxID=1173585 RepID=UPI001481042E|nr:FixH family protein [Ruegeria arenilitoris]